METLKEKTFAMPTSFPRVSDPLPQLLPGPISSSPGGSDFRISADNCKKRLQKFIQTEKSELTRFFGSDGAGLDRIRAPQTASTMVERLVKEGCPKETALRFMMLTMYDLIVLLDDSDSMELDENGDRKKTLRKVLDNVARIYTYARPEGIVSVKFFNTRQGTRNVTPAKVSKILGEIEYSGVTMIGTQLRKKVLDPFLYEKKGPVTKPLLIMIVTDGDVEGEKPGYLRKTLKNCIAKVGADARLGKDAVAFYFARVGNDEGARNLIEGLDNDDTIGHWIDCFPVECRIEEISDANPLAKWAVLSKLLLGALYMDIDEDDDPRDEDSEEELPLDTPAPRYDDKYPEDKD